MGLSLAQIADLNAFHLADNSLADTYSPDTSDSEGALFLTYVRGQVFQVIEADPEGDEDELTEKARDAVDDAPSIYTHTRWLQFIDLGAHQEEPECVSEWSTNLTEAAAQALHQVAERLASALVREFIEWRDEQDDEDEDEDTLVLVG